MIANHGGELVIDDLKTVDGMDNEGNPVKIVFQERVNLRFLIKLQVCFKYK